MRDGKIVIDEGSITAADEPITGFDLLDCADLNEALEIAAKHPVATFGTIEVRPYADD